LDTEEFIDIHFYRPIGYRWALLFNKLDISPNTVTIAGIIMGVVAGICFYFTSLMINILGMFLLIWANSYDSADGQLARMTGKKSELGRLLDGLCGMIWFTAIYLAIGCRMYPLYGIWIWILAVPTGFFHGKQASMADYYRNIHLFFLKGKAGSELSDSASMKEICMKISWKHNPVNKFFVSYYTSYTKDQESWTPNFQRMMQLIREKYPEEVPEWFRVAFREKSLPLMKYTNMLSFNTRVIALFVALLINLPWVYFVFEFTGLNIMLIYMVVKHERICKRFCEQLKTA
jgi:phosphatidylserine synthase